MSFRGGENVKAKLRRCKNNFQRFCYERELTYEQVAELLGISKYTAYAYYRGVRLPNRRTMKRFEAVFKEDARKVFDYEVKE
jgi:transcriptional regulator with XRE-family HTH domain